MRHVAPAAIHLPAPLRVCGTCNYKRVLVCPSDVTLKYLSTVQAVKYRAPTP